VLGGAGFIGSHVVDALIQEGYDVTVFDRPNIGLQNLNNSIGSVRFVQGDLCNPMDVEEVVKEKDIIFHFAGSTLPATSNQNPVYDVETNLVATIHLIETAVKYRVKKIIFASSGGTVYGIPKSLPIPETHPTDPICSYGITKLANEKYLSLFGHLHQLRYVVLRFGNPYGERQRLDNAQGVIPVFLGKLKKNQTIDIWGDGSVARDYFHISDLVSAVIKVTESKISGEIFNIAGGKVYTLLEILTVIEKVTGIKPRMRFLNKRRFDVPTNYLDITKARRLLDWKPIVSIEEGIQRTWHWVNEDKRDQCQCK
jgi:UDP-glucose 4-epimerase